MESSPFPFQIAHANSAAHSRPDYAGRFARFVSVVFSPPLLFVLTGLLVARFLSLPAERWLAISWTMAMVGLPLVLLLILHRRGCITDFDVSVRRERLLPLAVTQAGLLAGWVTLVWLEAPPLLQTVALFQLGQGALFLLITLFWKISLHTTSVATLAVLAGLLSAGAWLVGLLWLLVGVTAWSRVHLARHTPAQTVAGIGLTLFVWIGGGLLAAGG